MRSLSIRLHRIEILPCRDDARCFRWVIRARDGTLIGHSPYAFASEQGAMISAECWSREYAGRAAD